MIGTLLKHMKLYAGTSGFSYEEWRGRFYPEGLSSAQMLGYYATRLPSVELNNTFYRMPRPALVESWSGQVSEGFRFVVKAPRRITHTARLQGASDSVAYLFQVINGFGDRLGPVLFQLPPFLRKDCVLLRDFLASLPSTARPAFEFRHPSWFTEETYDVLRAHDAALCGGDVDDEGKSPPWVTTAPWAYLRLRRTSYSEQDLERWAERLTTGSLQEAYVFFKHELEGPMLAEKLTALVEAFGEPKLVRANPSGMTPALPPAAPPLPSGQDLDRRAKPGVRRTAAQSASAAARPPAKTTRRTSRKVGPKRAANK